jgi:SWI/SNF-related matrix-associated actin-dependent regulator of chromatin subfamily D
LHAHVQQSYTLRVYITQTAKNQPWQSTPEGADEEEDSVDFDTGKGIPTWELKIEGKLLNKVSVSPVSES